MTNAAEIEANRRNTGRQRVLKSAKIAYANFLYIVEVTVRDISPTGAKLRLMSAEPVPDEFHIIFVETKTMAPAEVVWRKGKEIGIRFIEPPKLLSEFHDARLRRFNFMV